MKHEKETEHSHQFNQEFISLSTILINKPQRLSCIDDSSHNSLLLFFTKAFITLPPLFFAADDSKYSLWSTL